MRYDTYRYLWPCRPTRAIAPNNLAEFERMGWWGQAKMDGDCVCLYVHPAMRAGDARATMQRGRHGDAEVTRWRPGARWDVFARSLPGSGWYVFEAELLHDSAAGAKDTVYLHDLLVADGEYLVGVSYLARYSALRNLCERFNDLGPTIGGEQFGTTHTVYAPGIWLARNHPHSFREWLDSPQPTGFEGLVLKDPNAPLRLCCRDGANASWSVKCRRPKANVSF